VPKARPKKPLQPETESEYDARVQHSYRSKAASNYVRRSPEDQKDRKNSPQETHDYNVQSDTNCRHNACDQQRLRARLAGENDGPGSHDETTGKNASLTEYSDG
jgi:hypothetical protein